MLPPIRPFIFCLAAAVLASVAGVSHAQQEDGAALVAQAEEWLNGVTTLTARFTQITSHGERSEGEFYLQRPYHTRFAYDEPDDLVLITTEIWLHVEDISRQQVTSYPVGQTLLKHLLTPEIRLTAEDITTTARRDRGVVLIGLRKETGDDVGVLQLAFSEEPFGLLGWTIQDAIGSTTQILFTEVERGATLAPRLFIPTDYKEDGQR